jgi:hypothetical protein
MDALTVAGQITPYVTQALTAYGSAVLTRATDAGADATFSLGQRILQRVWHRTPRQAAFEEAVRDAANDPGDEDFQAALRAQIKKALQADPDLITELAALLPAAGPTFTASGQGSVAVQHNTGIISTGDNAANER